MYGLTDFSTFHKLNFLFRAVRNLVNQMHFPQRTINQENISTFLLCLQTTNMAIMQHHHFLPTNGHAFLFAFGTQDKRQCRIRPQFSASSLKYLLSSLGHCFMEFQSKSAVNKRKNTVALNFKNTMLAY